SGTAPSAAAGGRVRLFVAHPVSWNRWCVVDAARLYFDWNSTTPPLREAVDAMLAAYEGAWGNPSSVHAEGRAARAKLEEARAAVADLVGARPADVVITSGGTEASNLALRSPYVGDETGAILVAPIEHAS